MCLTVAYLRYYGTYMTGLRKDCFTLDSQGTQDAQITQDGFVHVDAYITRQGIFDYLASELKYQWRECAPLQALPDDAIVRAYRPPSEVGSADTLKSFDFMPLTNSHPNDMLHPDNVGGYIVGTTKGGSSVDNGRVRTPLVLYRSDAIADYRAGKVELSLGAWNTFQWSPGVTEDGDPYDMRILNIRGNHVALVDRGRAGHDVRIMDSAIDTGVKKMKVTIGGASFDIDDNAAKLLEQERVAGKATVDRLTGEVEGLKTKVLTDEALDKLVDERATKKARAQEVAKMRQTCKDAGVKDVDTKSDDMVEGIYLGMGLQSSTHDEVNFSVDDKGQQSKDSGPIDIQARRLGCYNG